MKSLVSVVIPIYKITPSADEIKSLTQCFKILNKYPIRFVCPQQLDVKVYKEIASSHNNYDFIFFDEKYFKGVEGYNRLLLEASFYRKFNDSEFMLIYQLDAWVFSDQLSYWCSKKYDYIGSPWIDRVENNQLFFYPKGGNGGFSLRNVEAHVRVLSTFKIIQSPAQVWHYHQKFHTTVHLIIRLPLIALRMLGWQNNSFFEIKNTTYNEDVFWSKTAPAFNADFQVAPVNEELKFSTEMHPSAIYEMNDKKLPFGCHAWMKFEPEFWARFID